MVIGITGNFGVGKTTVAGIFHRLGARIINADRIAHKIILPGTAAYKQIIRFFGRGILSGGYISRRKLSRIVFFDKQKLKILNSITHPQIVEEIKSSIRVCSKREILAVDAALLIESGLLSRIEKLIVVKCSLRIVRDRLKKKGLTLGEIKARLGFQLPQHRSIQFADFIIDNSTNKAQTREQVKQVWYDISKDITYGARRAR
ncbi:dephospho-CoA kinase [Candidatus Omnitrophota bacterium]